MKAYTECMAKFYDLMEYTHFVRPLYDKAFCDETGWFHMQNFWGIVYMWMVSSSYAYSYDLWTGV